MRKWLLRIVGGAVVLGFLSLVVFAFLPKPVVVEVGRISRGNLTVSLDGEGKTRLRERYMIEAPVAGTLARVELHPGDAVKAGTPVAQLAPLPSALLDPQARAAAEARLQGALDTRRQARASVERTTVALRLARQELERTRTLTQGGAAAPQSLELAELEQQARQSELRAAQFAEQIAAHDIEVAQAALSERAKGTGLAGLTLTSPVDGQVLRVPREDEGPVAAGTALVEVGNTRDLEVVADVLTRDAVALRPGMKVLITRWGGEPVLPGRVRVVEPAAFTKVSPLGVEEQRVNVVVAFDANAAFPGLGEAYAVDVRFVRSEIEGVLRIPASAVFRHADGWAAFLVREGRAVLRPVKLGPSDALQFELREGLAEGDQVIVHPGELVRAGVRLTVTGE